MVIVARLLLLLSLLGCAGCGRFMAARMMQAPNSYPSWFSALAPVQLGRTEVLLTNFPSRFFSVTAPSVRLRYRIIEPADYEFHCRGTNWVEKGRPKARYDFFATFPGRRNAWTRQPQGTVFLLHGYGVGMFAMSPWAVLLAQHGWRCVLVDLRGHGRSTGDQIYFGLREAQDLRQLLDELASEGDVAAPVVAVGHSLGAVTALRWREHDPRIRGVVAMSPFAVLDDAVLNIAAEYSPWLPDILVRAGLNQLPRKLDVAPAELDTSTVIRRRPLPTMFVAAREDYITPVATVRELFQLSAPESELLVVPGATHETLPYCFAPIEPLLVNWIDQIAVAVRAGGK